MNNNEDLVNNIVPLILINKVTKLFGQNLALKELSASVMSGRITGLVGADGAGKTTLLRIICGLLLPNSGNVSVSGLDPVTQLERVHEIIGYMPQKFGLYEDLTVLENLELHAALRNVPKDDRKRRFDEILRFTSLSDFTDRLAGRLSGGMKQKLGLGCTLLSRPKILLMDEPGVGVDPAARRELWSMVRSLLSPERAVIWSTAYLEEAEACDTVILLNEGNLLFDGAPSGLSSQVQGHVFLIEGKEDRRAMIAPVMKMPATVDAVIQGRKVRAVTSDDGSELRSAGFSISSATPRFEDAFIKILGGARRGNSGITEFFTPRESGSEVVRAQNLTKRFGNFTAVDNISFSVKSGEILGLLGPNGAGKSTTFKMMCGLMSPTEGDCSIAGVNFRVAPGKARARLGYMAQKFSLYGDLSVADNLDFFSGVYGMSSSEKRATVNRVIEAFELNKYLKSSANELPLGYKQRLAMGCAIMHGPDVLFLDEPTSGVDPVTRREFWSYINAIALNGTAVMVTTHFMDEAEYCDRIALIYNGKTIALSSPEELKNEAQTGRDGSLEDAFISLIERSAQKNS